MRRGMKKTEVQVFISYAHRDPLLFRDALALQRT